MYNNICTVFCLLVIQISKKWMYMDNVWNIMAILYGCYKTIEGSKPLLSFLSFEIKTEQLQQQKFSTVIEQNISF